MNRVSVEAFIKIDNAISELKVYFHTSSRSSWSID